MDFPFPLRTLAVLAVLVRAGLALGAQVVPWESVAAPGKVTVGPKADNPAVLELGFDMVTGTGGADRIDVEMRDGRGNVLAAKVLGRAKAERRIVDFAPAGSDTLSFVVKASRKGEVLVKTAELGGYVFVLPLEEARLGLRNLGGGKLSLVWNAVAEAEGYRVLLRSTSGKERTIEVGLDSSLVVDGLVPGEKWELRVGVRRGAELVTGPAQSITVRQDPDRVWNFTWFGQSSSGERNRIEVVDTDELRFRLLSCTVLPDGQIDQKGGKFTTFHDGISFYYTIIDPARENFELSATFTVDFINPTADGQEGFGLLAMDSLGQHGVSMVNHYTNSAGIIATKFEETIGGTKFTSKDTLGSRFVWNLSPAVLAGGDSAIAQNGSNQSKGFSYASTDLTKAGKSYRLTLKKDNTGYHVWQTDLERPDAPRVVRTLYDPSRLLQLDRDHVYAGFAVARACNVTVSNVDFVVTDPAADPPGRPEPPAYVPLVGTINSSSVSGSRDYALAFTANADGVLRVTGLDGKLQTGPLAVKAGIDTVVKTSLGVGGNRFALEFTPDPAWKPGPGKALGQWDAGLEDFGPLRGPWSQELVVYHRTFPGKTIHVAPRASSLGEGTVAKPVSLAMALSFVQAGQEIVMAPGLYRITGPVVIERGNSGTAKAPKVVRTTPGTRAILDFANANGGMQVWGDWWVIDGIDVRNTPGNVKGLQIAGSHNVVRNVRTYLNGDTGLQISGSSTETIERWPAHNLILNCTSHDNKDPASNNADGFAAKLTSGPGNVFRGCVAYGNIDDGWDLFSKIESGPIGAVLIEDSVAYRNGSLSDGSGNGDGNGFKLGGDGIAVAHVLRNSLAFENGASGITSNSDPAVILERVTSWGNKGSNIMLYGKGDGSRAFVAKGVVSMAGGSADEYKEMPGLASPMNFFWTGAASRTSEGTVIGKDAFVRVDPRAVMALPARDPEDDYPGVAELRRKADGSIDLGGLFMLKAGGPVGVGADFE